MSAGRISGPDDRVYCSSCREILRYDREARQWRTVFVEDPNRCWSGRYRRWDHEPVKNVGRLIRALKRMRDKERMGI